MLLVYGFGFRVFRTSDFGLWVFVRASGFGMLGATEANSFELRVLVLASQKPSSEIINQALAINNKQHRSTKVNSGHLRSGATRAE